MHVRREFSFDDCAAVEAGLKNFRRYNQAMYISPQPDYIDQQLVENYFRAQEGSQEEAMYEDALSACAICSCNDNPDIPRKYKTKVGNRMQRELLASLRASKVDYMYYSGQLGLPGFQADREREARHKDITIVHKAHYLDKVTKKVRKTGINIVKKEGFKFIFNSITDESFVTRWTRRTLTWGWDLIPPGIKDKIKSTINGYFEKLGNVINYHAQRFAHTPVGKKVVEFYNKRIVPVVSRGYDKLCKAVEKTKAKFKSTWTRMKSAFA